MDTTSPAQITEPFVATGSIVRTIWGDADSILLIFAGAAAEFALNRAVDWLFFTEALPRDPMGRLFMTAAYAQRIVFAERATAEHALARIVRIHQAVEQQRGQRIPDWAHRDVLFLLIDYSERAYQLRQRALSEAERGELYSVFRRVGQALGIDGLPSSYAAWQVERERHLHQDLAYTPLTACLYRCYRDALGWWRYALLLFIQGGIVPRHVRRLLGLPAWPGLHIAMQIYQALTRLGMRALVHRVLIPAPYRAQLRRMDVPQPARRAIHAQHGPF